MRPSARPFALLLLLAPGCGSTTSPACERTVCEQNATCSEESGAPLCSCNLGWTGDGAAGCTDVDECTTGAADCDVNATCTNAEGSFTCACNAGWEGDGTACTDIDECALDTDDCGQNASCTNAGGSWTCACNAGWEGDGLVCTDIDECTANPTPCDPNATCANLDGSFSCACHEGYFGDGLGCTRLVYGHAVLIGHDYNARVSAMEVLLGNAIFNLANTSGMVNILGYQQYGDLTATGEVTKTNSVISARAALLGRSVNITPLTNYTELATNLAGKHVLLIYEMEMSVEEVVIAYAWRTELRKFLLRGGVIVVTDAGPHGRGLLDAAGVIATSGTTSALTSLTVALTSDPVGVGVTPYVGPSASSAFVTSEPSSTHVVVVNTSLLPVVIHKVWPCGIIGQDDAGYSACVESTGADTACPVAGAGATPTCQTDDCTTTATIPFAFSFYGTPSTTATIMAHGKIGFPGSNEAENVCSIEANTIAAHWDDLDASAGGASGGNRYQVTGSAPDRRFTVHWRTPPSSAGPGDNLDVRMSIEEGSNIVNLCYVDTGSGASYASGASATIGVAGDDSDEGLLLACNGPAVPDGTVIRVTPP